MSLLGPAQIRQLAAQLGVTPTKKLGQNFVHDPNTVRKIVALAEVSAVDRVLEVGPGLGSLTLGLTETGASVTAVELDSRLAKQLPTTVADLQPQAKLTVLNADAQQVTGVGEANVLVANLPYNVSVPILMHLLSTVPTLNRVLVMVQLEVGQRLAAAPNTKIYGAPSVKAAWYGTWELAGKVSRQIFWPVPGVDSVLVRCRAHPQPLGSTAERDLTFTLINAAFEQRRKMLRQALQATQIADLATAQQVTRVLATAGVDPQARAEDLDVHAYLAIARVLRKPAETAD